jgi:hypothetical protein
MQIYRNELTILREREQERGRERGMETERKRERERERERETANYFWTSGWELYFNQILKIKHGKRKT